MPRLSIGRPFLMGENKYFADISTTLFIISAASLMIILRTSLSSRDGRGVKFKHVLAMPQCRRSVVDYNGYLLMYTIFLAVSLSEQGNDGVTRIIIIIIRR